MRRLRDAISAWRHAPHRLFRLGLLLILAGVAWVGLSVLFFVSAFGVFSIAARAAIQRAPDT